MAGLELADVQDHHVEDPAKAVLIDQLAVVKDLLDLPIHGLDPVVDVIIGAAFKLLIDFSIDPLPVRFINDPVKSASSIVHQLIKAGAAHHRNHFRVGKQNLMIAIVNQRTASCIRSIRPQR